MLGCPVAIWLLHEKEHINSEISIVVLIQKYCVLKFSIVDTARKLVEDAIWKVNEFLKYCSSNT